MIRSKNTKPEIIVRKFLHNKGLRFRLHKKNLLGKPDIVLPKYKSIIFVNGCFWHGHKKCKYFKLPKTRTKWWSDKISKNKMNDSTVIKKLIDLGWKVIVIWECEIKSKNRENNLIILYNSVISNR